MNAKINTEVFMVKSFPDENKMNEVVLTESFEDVADVLSIVLNAWNDTQCRNDAVITSTKESALKVRAMAETIISCANKALENVNER